MFLFPPFSSLLWMILSRSTSPAANISWDTSPPSSARPHLGTSSVLKFRRHQDFHCSFRRTWGKYDSTKKDLILRAAADEATANMSLKADAEPNNNVSIEEEVSSAKVCFLRRAAPHFAAAAFTFTGTPIKHFPGLLRWLACCVLGEVPLTYSGFFALLWSPEAAKRKQWRRSLKGRSLFQWAVKAHETLTVQSVVSTCVCSLSAGWNVHQQVWNNYSKQPLTWTELEALF